MLISSTIISVNQLFSEFVSISGQTTIFVSGFLLILLELLIINA